MSHCPLCKEDASQHAYAGCPLFTGRELLVMVDRAGYIFSSPGVWYSMTMGHLLSFVEGVLAGPFAHLYDLRCNGVLLPDTLPETHLQDLGCCPGGRVDVSLRADALPHQPIHVELINSVVMTACSDCRDEKPRAAAVEVKRRSPPEEPRVAPSSIIPKRCATVGISMHALGSPYQIEVIGTLLERTVHVTQVSVEGRQRDLFNCFAKFGTVLRLRRRNQNIPAHLYTFAFVEFATAAAAQACIAASPLLFVERKMRVEHAKMPITNVDPSDSMPTKAFTAVMEFQHALQDVPAFTEGVHEVVPCVYGAAEARVARLAVFNPLSSDPSSSMTKEPATPTAPGPHRAMPSTTTKRVAPASPIDGQSSGLTSVAPHLSCDTFVDALTERLRQMQAVSALTQLSPTYSRVSHFNNLRAIGAFACFVYAQKPTENAGYRALDSIELALRCLSPIIETAGCIPGNVTDRAMLLSANLTTDALHVAIKVALRLHDAVQTARVALAGDHPGSFGAYINSRAIPTLEAELDASVAIVLLIEEVDPAAAHEMFARLVNTRGRSAPWGVSQSLLLSAARCPIGGLKEALLPGVRDFSLSFLCGNTTFKTFCTVEHALAIANTDFGNADEEAASALAADITGSPSFRAPTSRRVVPRRVDMETSEWV